MALDSGSAIVVGTLYRLPWLLLLLLLLLLVHEWTHGTHARTHHAELDVVVESAVLQQKLGASFKVGARLCASERNRNRKRKQ